jgi:O-antigen/teichoic acid export membrane protein
LKRKFFSNLVLLVLLNLLVKPFWLLGIDRTVQNVVGAEEYGFYFSMFNFSIILNILLDFGITPLNNRDIARHKHLVKRYFSNLITVKFILGGLYILLGLIIAMFIGYQWYQMKLLVFLLLNQLINSFILYLRSTLNGLHFFRTDSFLSVLDKFLMIIICSLLLWGNISDKAFRVEWLVYAQTASYLLAFFVVLVLVLLKTGFIRPQFDLTRVLSLLKRSIPFAILGLLMSVYMRIDSVMIERILADGKEQAGIYAQAFRILDAGAMAGYLFSLLLLPIFSRMIRKKESLEQLLRFSFLLIIVPFISFAVASAFHSEELMGLLYHKHVAESGRVFGVLMFSMVFVSSGYIFGTLLTANGNLRQLNYLALSSVVLNVLLNLLLIPGYKAFGSAMASLITLGLLAIFQIILSKRLFREHFNLKLIRLGMLCFGLVITGFFMRTFPVHWGLSFLIILSSGVLLSFGLNLVSIKKIRELIIDSAGHMNMT